MRFGEEEAKPDRGKIIDNQSGIVERDITSTSKRIPYHMTISCVIDAKWFETPIFKTTFLEQPCRGCGSNHSLLKEIGCINGIPHYVYRCRVVEPSSLYLDNNSTRIRINFRIEAEALASGCRYDFNEALQRMGILMKSGKIEDEESYDAFEQFFKQVHAICETEFTRKPIG
jgi:hypothetical protein